MKQQLFLLITCLFLFACNRANESIEQHQTALLSVKQPFYTSFPFDADLLESGDILLRKGSGTVSNYITALLNEEIPVSHCGMLIRSENGWEVVHAISKDNADMSGVIAEPLSTFIRESLEGTLVIVRLEADKNERKKIADLAKELSDKNIPFDFSFDLNNPDRMYCTEVIWKVTYEVFNKNLFTETIKPGEIEILTFSNFFNPQYFKVIFNDFEKS